MSDPRNKKSYDLAEQYKDRILNRLKIYSSQTKPLTSNELTSVYAISDVVVRQAIGKLRDDGEPIASGARGFFFAKNAEELEATIADYNSRIAAMSIRKNALKKTQERLRFAEPRQKSLFKNEINSFNLKNHWSK